MAAVRAKLSAIGRAEKIPFASTYLLLLMAGGALA